MFVGIGTDREAATVEAVACGDLQRDEQVVRDHVDPCAYVPGRDDLREA